MDNMINSESKCSSDLSIANPKILPKRSSAFQEHIQRICAYFMLPSHVNCNNIDLLLQENVGKCVICKNTRNTMCGSYSISCNNGCNMLHNLKSNFFVICDNCVNLCTNDKKMLVRTIYLCGNDWILSSVYEMTERCIFISDAEINIINDIIASDNIIDRYYHFDSKCTLLIIMSYYDANSFLIKIPRDIVKYMFVNFIYYDR